MLQAFRGYRSEELPPAVRREDDHPIPFRSIARVVFSPFVAVALSVLTYPFVAFPLIMITEALLNDVWWTFVAGSRSNEFDLMRGSVAFVVGGIGFAAAFAIVVLAAALVQRRWAKAIVVGVALMMNAGSWGFVWIASHIPVPFRGF